MLDCWIGPLLLVAAVAVDAFVTAVGYGANRIRIPPLSLLLMAAVCTVSLILALGAGFLLTPFLSPQSARLLGCAVLFLLGLLKLAGAGRKTALRPIPPGGLGRLAAIFYRPEQADADRSQSLSPGESAALAVVLSLDGVAAGLGAGAAGFGLWQTGILSMLVHTAVLIAGLRLGAAAGKRIKLPAAALCGSTLILLALARLGG